MAPHIKGHGRRKLHCLLALTFTDKPIYSVAEAFLCWAGIGTYFFGILMWTENQQLAKNALGLQLQVQIGTAETSSLMG